MVPDLVVDDRLIVETLRSEQAQRLPDATLQIAGRMRQILGDKQILIVFDAGANGIFHLLPRLENDPNLAVAWKAGSAFDGTERAKFFAPWLF